MRGKLVMAVAATILLCGCGATKVITETGSTSTPASNTARSSGTPQASTKRVEGPGVPKSGRCGGITVNEHTSCAFARVVVQDYEAHPSSTFQAHSPVTGLTYTMHCRQVVDGVACNNGGDSDLSFNGPPASSPASSETPAQAAPPVTEGPGSASHATDDEFCSTHECIGNFTNGTGTIVQCADGEWSHSGGLSGACSDHGGEQ